MESICTVLIYESELVHSIFILYQKKRCSVSDLLYLDLDPDPGAANPTLNRKYPNNFLSKVIYFFKIIIFATRIRIFRNETDPQQ